MSLRLTAPSSITPARSIARSSRRSLRSQIRSSIACINRSCGISSKHEAMSVSTTHRLPRQHSSMSTCKASCADRRGRNPNEQSTMSASKIGSSTSLAAVCTILSRTVEMPRLLSFPERFGISRSRAGSGR